MLNIFSVNAALANNYKVLEPKSFSQTFHFEKDFLRLKGFIGNQLLCGGYSYINKGRKNVSVCLLTDQYDSR